MFSMGIDLAGDGVDVQNFRVGLISARLQRPLEVVHLSLKILDTLITIAQLAIQIAQLAIQIVQLAIQIVQLTLPKAQLIFPIAQVILQSTVAAIKLAKLVQETHSGNHDR
jgi:hypothetical protein